MSQSMLFTKDEKTAKHLQEQGFPLVSKTFDGWTFINLTEKNSAFISEEFKKNIASTDTLFI